MMPGMDPRMEALSRAMPPEGAPAEDPMAAPPEGAAGGDPAAELMDIAMRLEAVLPALDPTVAEKIAQVLPVLQEAAAPKPEGVPQMGPDMGGGDVGMGLPV